MNADVYNRLRTIVYERSGIRIKDGKASMVASRIARRLRALNLRDELEYVQHLETTMEEEIVHLLDAISTNVTSFFREPHHFDLVREVFPRWLKAGQRRFRFWSSACSSGEEPYTLAMTLLEAAAEAGVRGSLDVKILATDISTEILSYAQEGVYEERRTQGVPPELRRRHFQQRSVAGEPVYATAAGRVRFADWFRGYGRMLILDHGEGYFTVMGHLDALDVTVGQEVAAGDRVGAAGETGSLSGARLYFEIRSGADAVDPAEWLELAPQL